MKDNKEKQILYFIKFAPAISILVLYIFITLFMLYDNKQSVKDELQSLKNEFLQKNKQKISQEINRAYDYILFQKTNSEKELKKELKQKVYEAHSIIKGIYKANRNKSKEEILKLLKPALQEIRFYDGRGYFYIHRANGVNFFHPTMPELENNNLLNIKDIKGDYFVRRIINSAKNTKEGYDQYFWYAPNKNKEQFRKIVFYKVFKELDIVIVTGEYLDDFESILKKQILEYLNSFTYDKNGYIFLIDYEGTTLAHINKKLRGLKFKDIKNQTHKLLLNDILKQKDGFLSYLGEYNSNKKIISDKVSYLKSFEPWQWIIGTGFYQDELALQIEKRKKELLEKNEEELFNLLLISILITIILLSVSIYVSNILQYKFNEYKEQNKLLTQQSKMATMGEMIANIAHQWRQPLNMISTAASSMRFNKEHGFDSKESDLESIDYILKSTRHLSQTIDDFRNYFNPNKGKVAFNLINTYNKIINFTSSKFKNKDILILNNVENVKVESLENELIQAMLNILNNACDVFDEKEQFIKYLFIDMEKKDEENIQIIIKDNAGGIPENVLPKIFEPYFTTKHQSQGTGIGLYMTYNIIVKNLKGNIEASNETYEYKDVEYIGAKFTITLPIKI